MKFVVLFATVFCTVCAWETADKQWEIYKDQFNKTYETEAEHKRRYEIFKNNVRKIDEHNENFRKGLVKWTMHLNQFADMELEEFAAFLTYKSDMSGAMRNGHLRHVSKGVAPDSVDWRKEGIVTPVKNQHHCGSCWTFSTTGALESLHALRTGKLVSFSEQNLLDCCSKENGYLAEGCGGGNPPSAFMYVVQNGIETEAQYPYESKNDNICRQNSSAFKIENYIMLKDLDEDELRDAVGNVGPVAIALNGKALWGYHHGIFHGECDPTNINHAVLVVGYGSKDGDDYWIIKNSWGEHWGEEGYIRLRRGHNICGIPVDPVYPVDEN